jgi:hypothetical protein
MQNLYDGVKMIHVKLINHVGKFAENKDIARDIRMNQIIPALEKNNEVILDFENIDSATQTFIHALRSDLMRIFGSVKIGNFLGKLGLKDDEAIEHPWINKSLEKAQQKVESRNYEIRKNLLKFDDVMNEQRKVVYVQ